MEFSQWLFHKYLDWQGELGQRKSLTAFAAYIGVSQPQITAYLKGDYLPKGENLGKMAAVLGVEIYDVMGMPRPLDRQSPMLKWAAEMLADPQIAAFMKTVYAMDVGLREPMLAIVSDMLATVYGIPDPEKRKKLMQRWIDLNHKISDEEYRHLLS